MITRQPKLDGRAFPDRVPKVMIGAMKRKGADRRPDNSTGHAVSVHVRLPSAQLAALDAWRHKFTPVPSRSKAVREALTALQKLGGFDETP